MGCCGQKRETNGAQPLHQPTPKNISFEPKSKMYSLPSNENNNIYEVKVEAISEESVIKMLKEAHEVDNSEKEKECLRFITDLARQNKGMSLVEEIEELGYEDAAYDCRMYLGIPSTERMQPETEGANYTEEDMDICLEVSPDYAMSPTSEEISRFPWKNPLPVENHDDDNKAKPPQKKMSQFFRESLLSQQLTEGAQKYISYDDENSEEDQSSSDLDEAPVNEIRL